MFVTELLVAVAVIAALVIAARSFHTVGSGEVQHLVRFGQFRRTLRSGIHMILPIGVKFYSVSIRKQRLAVRVRAYTSEGLAVALDLQTIFTVTDPGLFSSQQHAVDGFPNTVVGLVRQEISSFTLGHLRKALDVAQEQFRCSIADRARSLGITVNDMMVFALHIPRELQLHGVAESIGEAPRTMDLIRLDATREIGSRAVPIQAFPPPTIIDRPNQ